MNSKTKSPRTVTKWSKAKHLTPPRWNKFDQYLAEQARYKDSPLTKFLNIVELNLILKELNPAQREEFLELLEKEKFEELLEFIGNNIPDLRSKLKKEINIETEKIKNKTTSDGGKVKQGGTSDSSEVETGNKYDNRKANIHG